METKMELYPDSDLPADILLNAGRGDGSTPLMCSTFSLKHEVSDNDQLPGMDDDRDEEDIDRSTDSQSGKKRGKYQRISDETKRRIVAAFEAEENILLVAQEQGIKPRTAYTIVRRAMRGDWPPKNPRGGARHLKVDDEVRACLAGILESNPQATQEAIRLQLERQLPKKPKIALSTLSTAMDGLLYEVYTPHPSGHPLHRDLQASGIDPYAEARYAQWFMQHGRHQKLIFIDERAYNVWTRRFQGKKETNTSRKMFHVIGRQRGKNLTILLAMGLEGLYMMEIIQGDVNEDIFAQLLNRLFEKLKDKHFILLTEHTAIHRIHTMDSSLPKLAYYPYGCSHLSPLTYAFKALKSEVRRRLAIRRADLYDHAGADKLGVTLHQLRLRLLENELRQASSIINPSSCAQWFQQVTVHMENQQQKYQEQLMIKQEVKDELHE